jgi:hypothetical protein
MFSFLCSGFGKNDLKKWMGDVSQDITVSQFKGRPRNARSAEMDPFNKRFGYNPNILRWEKIRLFLCFIRERKKSFGLIYRGEHNEARKLSERKEKKYF